MMGEFDAILKIKKILNSKIIGDDTAPIIVGNKTLVATNDILLEDQHFLNYFPIDNLGWKAISVNVSDIIASGGKPEFALISLLLPKDKTHLIEPIYQSIKKACLFYQCQVIGGNITKSEKLGIDIFMIGNTKKFINRRGAKPDDYLYLTGTVGDSKAGLELLMMRKKIYESFEKKLIERHLKPIININLSEMLIKNATSSIDVSDGLSSDINHISRMSKVRIDINSSKIPVSYELKKYTKKYNKNILNYGLTGGEDYKILFTSKKIIKETKNLYLIGRVNPGEHVFIDKKKLIGQGFDHFFSL